MPNFHDIERERQKQEELVKGIRESDTHEPRRILKKLSFKRKEESPKPLASETFNTFSTCVEIISQLLQLHPGQDSWNQAMQLFYRIDEGNHVIIEDIENEMVKESLSALFPLLYMKSKNVNGTLMFLRSEKTPKTLQLFAPIMERNKPHQMKPKETTVQIEENVEINDSGDDMFGPPLPGLLPTKPNPEKSTSRKSRSEEWARVRAKKTHASSLKRESWMTELPSLGIRPTTKVTDRRFSSKPSTVKESDRKEWTSIPDK